MVFNLKTVADYAVWNLLLLLLVFVAIVVNLPNPGIRPIIAGNQCGNGTRVIPQLSKGFDGGGWFGSDFGEWDGEGVCPWIAIIFGSINVVVVVVVVVFILLVEIAGAAFTVGSFWKIC